MKSTAGSTRNSTAAIQRRARSASPNTSWRGGLSGYLLGFGLAILLTIASFLAAQTDLIYQPAVISALVVLAVAQMGVHLVFFLHLTTGPDNTNNVLALAFGVLIVALVVLGSVWIMAHLNENMTAMSAHQAEMMP